MLIQRLPVLFFAPDDGGGPPAAGGEPTRAENADGSEQSITSAQLTEILGKKTAQHKRQLERVRAEVAQQVRTELAQSLGVEPDEFDGLAERLNSSADAEQQKRSWESRVKALNTRLEAREKELADLRSARARADIERVVRAAGDTARCIDNEALHLLIKDRLRAVDGEVLVLGDDGEPDPRLTVQSIINETLAAKPHLQAPPSHAGGGSRPSSNGAAHPDTTTREGRRALLEPFFAGRPKG